MKTLFAFLLVVSAAFGQTNFLTQTSTTAAMNATQNYVLVTSATGFAANRDVYIDQELMTVGKYYSSGLNIPVIRNSEKKSGHISGAMVLVGKPFQFSTSDPFGEPIAAQTPFAAQCPNILSSPYININTGGQFLCGLLNQWVPGFGTATLGSAQPTAAVASAAGLITPSGPLFHVTGALAITGFNIPLGFNKGGFCIIPDGTFTTTTANNIALASTAVVSKQLCYTYDSNAAKPFFPSY